MMWKLFFVAIAILLAQSDAMALEEPDYVVVESFEDFELRRYSPYIVAEVDVRGDFKESGNSAFRVLAGYIFGDNESATKMAMTAPVESRQADAGEKMAMTAPVISSSDADNDKKTYAFVMESQYTMETLPVPVDSRIRIREVPSRTMAVRRYSGRWTESKYVENVEVLHTALSDANMPAIGEPVLARYNSPFSLPFMRRNEVMVEIAAGQ